MFLRLVGTGRERALRVQARHPATLLAEEGVADHAPRPLPVRAARGKQRERVDQVRAGLPADLLLADAGEPGALALRGEVVCGHAFGPPGEEVDQRAAADQPG